MPLPSPRIRMMAFSWCTICLVWTASTGQVTTQSASQPSSQFADPVRYPWDTEVDWKVRQSMRLKLAKICFEGERLEVVFKSLSKMSGITVMANWTALSASGIEKDVEVNLQVQDVTLDSALKLILESAGGGETELAFMVRLGIVQVSTREDFDRDTIRVIYVCDSLNQIDDADLRRRIKRGLEIAAEEGATGLSKDFSRIERVVKDAAHESLKQDRARLIKLVQQVDPQSWWDNGGNVGDVGFLNDRLVVSQCRRAQEQIYSMLSRLQNMREGTGELRPIPASYVP